MTPGEIRVQTVIELLLENGWEPDGETRSETVRVPTAACPAFGKSGGELRTFGGRMRFAKGDRRVTVGKVTCCFYIYGPDGPTGFQNVPTRVLDWVRETIIGT